MATRMQQRRGTAEQWTTANPILAAGEIGFESDTNQFKIGDGINHWADLSYFKNLDGLGGSLDDYILLTEKGEPDGVATLNSSGFIPLSQLPTGAALDAEVQQAVNDHSAVTTDVHGIVDTAQLITRTQLDADFVTFSADTALLWQADIEDAVTTHQSDTTSVHGIADTSLLATMAYADAAVSALGDNVGSALSFHAADTTNVHGIADTTALATKTYADDAADAADTSARGYADSLASNYDAAGTASSAVSAHSSDTTSVHGIADTSKIVLSDALSTTLDGDLTISGDLTVTGTTTTVSAQDLVVSDPLIYIGEGNTANLVDLGVVSSFNDGTYQHSGIVRDSSAGKWKFFKGITDEPTTTINFAQGSLDDLAVNNVEVAGVVFSDGTQTKQGVASITPIIQKTASYTLSSLTERDSLIEVSSSSATTITIPANSAVAYPVGTSLDILQTSTGQVTIAGAAGVTVNATPGLKLRSQWSSATLFKRSTDTWVVMGDLTA